jgi:hypothetical protein
MIKGSIVVVAVLATVAVVRSTTPARASLTPIVLSGVTRGCFLGKQTTIDSLNLAAFGVADARPLLAQLQKMDTLSISDSDPAAMDRFLSEYEQMKVMDTTTTSLARTISDWNGAFTMNVAPTDSVLLVGYEDMEDRPIFYSYQMVSGLSNLSFTFSIPAGGCSG